MGSVNAAVLPVPVCAMPMRSCPAMIGGMAAVWIGRRFGVAGFLHGLQNFGIEAKVMKGHGRKMGWRWSVRGTLAEGNGVVSGGGRRF